MNIARIFINTNISISKWFDKTFLSDPFRIDGNLDYLFKVVPKYITEGAKLYDVGGGKQPMYSVKDKYNLGLTIIGIDIDEVELKNAPHGSYDKIICADISSFEGQGDGDFVLCQALLEHVENTEVAIKSISTLLKPGGKALIFVPSRNAIFARLNNFLPQKIKKALLYSIYPKTRHAQGFPSYYNKCTPRDFLKISSENSLNLVESRYYYISSYFQFFFPLYLLWRLWIITFRFISKEQAAETFCMVFEKKKSLD